MKHIFFLLFLVTFVSCQDKGQLHSVKVMQGNAFGTTYTIQYFSKTPIDIEKGLDSVFHVVNKSVSTYASNSDISKINNGDSTVVVDKIFRDVFILSEKVYKESKGFFDPTIGVLRNAYGFGDEAPLKIIDQPTLDSLRQYVGFDKVHMTSEGTIKKDLPEVYFDFNAVAKGYGIDCVGNFLKSKGIKNYLVELGGEILAKGKQLEKNQPWIAGVEGADSPLNNRKYVATVALHDIAMASSGNYRKFRVDSLSGKRYVHTINPHTGKAEQLSITSATVIAGTCAEADAYATAFMAMGLTKAKALLKELVDVDAYFTYEKDGRSQYFASGGFAKKMQ